MAEKIYEMSIEAIHVVEKLSDTEAGVLIKNILKYVNNTTPVFNERFDEIAFLVMKHNYLKLVNAHNIAENHWNWKGGITPENHSIRQSSSMQAWRSDVFKRDKYTCQSCGRKGGTLHAHHIKRFADYPELRTVLSNGLTLCKPCHNKVHKKGGVNNG